MGYNQVSRYVGGSLMFMKRPNLDGAIAVGTLSVSVLLCFFIFGIDTGSRFLGILLMLASIPLAIKAIIEWNHWPLEGKPEWTWENHVNWRNTLLITAVLFFIGGLAVYNWLPILVLQ